MDTTGTVVYEYMNIAITEILNYWILYLPIVLMRKQCSVGFY